MNDLREYLADRYRNVHGLKQRMAYWRRLRECDAEEVLSPAARARVCERTGYDMAVIVDALRVMKGRPMTYPTRWLHFAWELFSHPDRPNRPPWREFIALHRSWVARIEEGMMLFDEIARERWAQESEPGMPNLYGMTRAERERALAEYRERRRVERNKA